MDISYSHDLKAGPRTPDQVDTSGAKARLGIERRPDQKGSRTFCINNGGHRAGVPCSACTPDRIVNGDGGALRRRPLVMPAANLRNAAFAGEYSRLARPAPDRSRRFVNQHDMRATEIILRIEHPPRWTNVPRAQLRRT